MKARKLPELFFKTICPKLQVACGNSPILLLGATGSGKSTFINHMLGHQFERTPSGYLSISDDTSAEPYAKMESTYNESETTYPSAYKDKAGNVYCDTAGFFDTRHGYAGMHQMVMQVFNNITTGIKAIVIMLDIYDVECRYGEKIFLELSRILNLQQIEQHHERIFFAVNLKGTSDINKRNIIARLNQLTNFFIDRSERYQSLFEFTNKFKDNDNISLAQLKSSSYWHMLKELPPVKAYNKHSDDTLISIKEIRDSICKNQTEYKNAIRILRLMRDDNALIWDIAHDRIVNEENNTSSRSNRPTLDNGITDDELYTSSVCFQAKLAKLSNEGFAKSSFQFAKHDHEFERFEQECTDWIEAKLEPLKKHNSKRRELSIELSALDGFSDKLKNELLAHLKRLIDDIEYQHDNLHFFCQEILIQNLVLPGKPARWYNWWPTSYALFDGPHTRIDFKLSVGSSDSVALKLPSTGISYNRKKITIGNRQFITYDSSQPAGYQSNHFYKSIPPGLTVGVVWGLRIDDPCNQTKNIFSSRVNRLHALTLDYVNFIKTHPWLFEVLLPNNDFITKIHDHDQRIVDSTTDRQCLSEAILSTQYLLRLFNQMHARLSNLGTAISFQEAYKKYIHATELHNPKFKQERDQARDSLQTKLEALTTSMLSHQSYYDGLYQNLIMVKNAFPASHVHAGYIQDFIDTRQAVYGDLRSHSTQISRSQQGVFQRRQSTAITRRHRIGKSKSLEEGCQTSTNFQYI